MRLLGTVIRISSWGALVAIAGLLATVMPLWGAGLLVTAPLAVAFISRLDGWQRWYMLTLLFAFLASSTVPNLGVAYYARYLALGGLAVWTWIGARSAGEAPDLAPFARRLIWGLWMVSLLALGSSLWSVSPLETSLQAVALLMLSATIHGLIRGRWSTGATVVASDIGVAVVVLAVIGLAGIAADAAGVLETRVRDGRYQGLFANPNLLGMSYVLIVPLALGVYTVLRKRIFLWCLIPLVANLIMSGSRTAAIALLAGVVWVLVHYGVSAYLRVLYAAVGGAIIAVLGGFQFPAISGLIDRFSANQGGDLLNMRTIAWRDAWDLSQEHLLAGWGYATAPVLFERKQGSIQFTQTSVHNSYLQFFLELGAIGCIALAILATAWIGGILATSRSRRYLWYSASIVGGILVQFTESSLFGTGQVYPYLFWFALAAIASLASGVVLPHSTPRPRGVLHTPASMPT